MLTEEGRIMARETRRGVANDTLIRRCPNGETPYSVRDRTEHFCARGEPGELKYLSN